VSSCVVVGSKLNEVGVYGGMPVVTASVVVGSKLNVVGVYAGVSADSVVVGSKLKLDGVYGGKLNGVADPVAELLDEVLAASGVVDVLVADAAADTEEVDAVCDSLVKVTSALSRLDVIETDEDDKVDDANSDVV
jgi:hypothetical protein